MTASPKVHMIIISLKASHLSELVLILKGGDQNATSQDRRVKQKGEVGVG